MSAFESAIDDSFDPVPQPPPDEEFTDESFFDNAYRGPRNGHWEVASSIGSFIDDRCPTVYGYHHKSHGGGHGAHIDEGLAKRLIQATIEDKRAATIAAARSTPPADHLSDRVKSTSTAPGVKTPKPFYVPALRNRPYNPVLPEFVKAADHSPTPPAAEAIQSQRKPSSTPKLSVSVGRSTPSPAVASTKAASFRPDPSPLTGRTIKILGKNGEVAFVDLPSLPKSYTQAPSSVKDVAADKAIEHPETTWQQDKSAHSFSPNTGGSSKSKNSLIPAIRSSVAEEHTQKQDNQWTSKSLASQPKQDRRSPSVVMSGALPVPSPWVSPVPQSAAASCNDSGVLMGGMSAVASKIGSGMVDSNRHSSAISQGVFSVAQKIANMPSNSNGNPSPIPVDPPTHLFDEVGMGVTIGFPVGKVLSERSNRTTHHSNFGSV